MPEYDRLLALHDGMMLRYDATFKAQTDVNLCLSSKKEEEEVNEVL